MWYIFFETNNKIKDASFQTNVSFSTDFNVALEFGGDSGIVIGMNMKRTFNNPHTPDRFVACDVSWI